MTAIYGVVGEDGRELAWPLLSLAVERHWGWTALPAVGRSGRGKPLFQGLSGHWFSLSHSGGIALCALSGAPVGVDVELVRPRRAGLARYVLGEGEFQWYQDRGSRWDVLYSLWTLKEARCKCTGEGLRRPPKDIAVPLLEPGEAGELEGLYFRAYGGDGWRAAVCSAGERPPRLADMPENI